MGMLGEPIKNFSGQIIAWISTDGNGKKTVRSFTGEILGYYDPIRDVTTDFIGRIIAHGDASGMLIRDK